MRKRNKNKESKLNVVLAALLVVFVCLLSFSVGVISGKGWSDREYTVRHIKKDSHLQAAIEDQQPLGDDMSDKEVELLTQRALDQARAEKPQIQKQEEVRKVASNDSEPAKEKESQEESNEPDDAQPDGREASTAKLAQPTQREVSSLIPRPTTPAPKTIEYTVQVAAYKTMEEAEGRSQLLIDKGFPAFPVKALINGDTWYRVSIGSFKTKKQALKYEKALKKQAVVKSTFVQEITRLK